MRQALQQNPALKWLIILSTICLVSVGGCYGLYNLFFHPATRVPRQFPNTDIVYNAGRVLGFINADGSGAVTIRYLQRRSGLTPSDWDQPLITADNQTLIVTEGVFPTSSGGIYVGRRGKYAVSCEQWGVNHVELAGDGQSLILFSPQGLVQHAPEDCGTNNPPQKIYKGVDGFLSLNEQYVAQVKWVGQPAAEEPVLTILQLDTGLEKQVGIGYYPAWSPDSQWVAYTGADGIYVVNVTNDSSSRLIVAHQNPDATRPFYSGNPQPSLFFPPIVAWSPDGKWLVYALYQEGRGEDTIGSASFYAIYKLNVQTGEETKLIDGGLSPFWRWPVDEP